MDAKRMPDPAEIMEDVVLGDCDEMLYFHLQAQGVEFTLGLSDILACLKFAEREGIVPQIPVSWWCEMYGIYPELEEPCDVPEDEDEEI